MDELLDDLDQFLAHYHLPPRLRRVRDDEGMKWDMVAALPSDDAFPVENWSEHFRIQNGAILADLVWRNPGGSLEHLDKDVTDYFCRFRESDGILERSIRRDQSVVLYNVFTGTPGSSHYHCIQIRVTGPDLERALAADPGPESVAANGTRSKNAPLLYMLVRDCQRWNVRG